MALTRLVEQGVIQRLGRGLYGLQGAKATEHHARRGSPSCAGGRRVPPLGAPVHKLSTQSPHEVWLALDVNARKPALDWPPVCVVRFSGTTLTYGVDRHTFEGVPVKITSAAKTVADAFKYRHKIGLDVAIEALTEYRWKRGAVDALMKAAAGRWRAVVLRPYLEAIS